MEVNGNYAVSFSLTTPNSNYRITHAKVWVDGSSVASQNFSDVTSATIAAAGSLGLSVGAFVSVKVEFTWKIYKGTVIVTGAQALRALYNAAVRSTITGTCTCATDENFLDSNTFTYSGTSYDNDTSVKWETDTAGDKTKKTSIWGTYSFTNVPCGHTVTMSVDSMDTHIHGTQYVKTCFYETEQNVGRVGTRWYLGLDGYQDHQVHDFDPSPDQVEP